jgi:hypothetical protein
MLGSARESTQQYGIDTGRGSMVGVAENEASDKRLGYIRLAMVSSVTAAFVGLGIGVAYAAAPAPGDVCSLRNATTHDAKGHTMWCNPTTGTQGLVWKYPAGS